MTIEHTVLLSRRTALLAGAGLLAASSGLHAQSSAETRAWGFSFPSIEEGVLRFADFKDRVLLVTNTASFCGFTYQYEALEKLHASLQGRGLSVIGIPSQDFGQESASDSSVKGFCDATFGVQFPMTGLLHVRGPQADPFYQWVHNQKNWQPSWNFNKVLISRNGQIAGVYGSTDEPGGSKLTQAIEAALKA